MFCLFQTRFKFAYSESSTLQVGGKASPPRFPGTQVPKFGAAERAELEANFKVELNFKLNDGIDSDSDRRLLVPRKKARGRRGRR